MWGGTCGEDFDQDIIEENFVIEDIIDGEEVKTELPPEFGACFREQKLFWEKLQENSEGVCVQGPGVLLPRNLVWHMLEHKNYKKKKKKFKNHDGCEEKFLN